MSFAFGIKIETDQLATDSLYPYSPFSLSSSDQYSLESEFLSLLESKVEGSRDISMESDRSLSNTVIKAMDTGTTDAGVTAGDSMAADAVEANGGMIAEEMQRNDSGSTGLGRTDAEGAAKMEDHSNNQSDIRSTGAKIGSRAAKKALTGDRIALSSKAVGDAIQRSSESESPSKGSVGDDPNTALMAGISDDLMGLSSKELDRLVGVSLGFNEGDKNISGSSGLSERFLKSTAQSMLSKGEGGAESFRAGARGVSDSAKLVVVDLRSNRGVGKSERDFEKPGPAVSRSKLRPSKLGSRASVSDLELEARQFAGTRDTQDVQKSEAADSSGAQTRLLARIINQELKDGFQPERFGGAFSESRASMVERFKEALRNEVVRSSSIILKDEGKGELRLILKPESLGNVRIRLSLNNNHIEGRIIVENNTVKEMFESNLQNLNNAFQKEGFSSSSLEVFVSGGNEQKRQKEMQMPSFSAVQEFENTMPIQDEYISDDWLVNITV